MNRPRRWLKNREHLRRVLVTAQRDGKPYQTHRWKRMMDSPPFSSSERLPVDWHGLNQMVIEFAENESRLKSAPAEWSESEWEQWRRMSSWTHWYGEQYGIDRVGAQIARTLLSSLERVRRMEQFVDIVTRMAKWGASAATVGAVLAIKERTQVDNALDTFLIPYDYLRYMRELVVKGLSLFLPSDSSMDIPMRWDKPLHPLIEQYAPEDDLRDTYAAVKQFVIETIRSSPVNPVSEMLRVARAVWERDRDALIDDATRGGLNIYSYSHNFIAHLLMSPYVPMSVWLDSVYGMKYGRALFELLSIISYQTGVGWRGILSTLGEDNKEALYEYFKRVLPFSEFPSLKRFLENLRLCQRWSSGKTVSCPLGHGLLVRLARDYRQLGAIDSKWQRAFEQAHPDSARELESFLRELDAFENRGG